MKIYFVTDHKTGTVWTQKILYAFCQHTNKFFIQKSFVGIKQVLRSILYLLEHKKNIIRYIYGYLFKDKIYILNRADIKIKNKKNKIVLIIRDPRDICISAANYDGKDWNQEEKNKKFYEYKNTVSDMTFEEIVLWHSKNEGLKTTNRLCSFIKNNNALVIKYEDLFSDIYNNFFIIGKIAEYLNLNKLEKIILKNIYISTHLRNTGKDSHSISGQPKQYSSLSLSTLNQINNNLREQILFLGYQI